MNFLQQINFIMYEAGELIKAKDVNKALNAARITCHEYRIVWFLCMGSLMMGEGFCWSGMMLKP
jgi:hypothetical protein